jgi:ankyrin repeat protein
MVTATIITALTNRIALCKTMNRSLDIGVVLRLIKNQDWTSFVFLCGSRRDDINSVILDMESNGLAIVHLCCQNQAPLRVFQALYKCQPHSFEWIDRNGRFPIHEALNSGATPDVIHFLIENTSILGASAQDRVGKTPLHYLCECYIWLYRPLQSINEKLWEDTLIDMLHRLCEKDRSTVNVEDDEGRTAIEIAIENGAPYQFVRILQRTSAGEWRSRRQFKMSHNDMQELYLRQVETRRRFLEQPSEVSFIGKDDELTTSEFTKLRDKRQEGINKKISQGEKSKQGRRKSFQAMAA